MREKDQDGIDAARVVAGDIAAFEGIVSRWQRPMINLAWRFCRNRALAEDMAQEVFLKAFRSLAAFRGDSAFSTWLTAIALNTYRSRLRSEGQPLFNLDPARALGSDPGVLRGIAERQSAELVRRAVLSLPARYRDAIAMFYFEEQSLSAAALALKTSQGTLKARLSRGRELLRQKCEGLRLVRMGPEEK